MESVKVFALGGLDEYGKNMYVLEVANDLYVVEAGSKYPDKTSPGIDVIIPNFDYLKANADRIRGFIISHGFWDEMGALAYLFKDPSINAPIYASKMTIAFIKMHTQQLNLPHEYQFVEVKPNDRLKIGNHHFTFFQTAHMIAGSFGFALESEQGSIVYMGSFIVEYNDHPQYQLDINALAKIAESPVLLLMCESHHAARPGFTAPSHRLSPLVNKPLQDAQGRSFVALYDYNLYNLNEIAHLAIEWNKKLIFYGKEANQVLETLQSIGEFVVPKANLATMEDLFRIREQDIIIVMLGSRESLYRQIELLATGESEERKLIIGPTDTFVVAAPPQLGTEILAVSAIDELYRTGAKVVNITKKQIAGMHAQEEDIKTVLALLKPKYYMPISGEFRHILANAKIAVSMNQGYTHLNTFVLDNGMILRFENGKVLPISDQIETGDLLVDGSGVGDVGDTVLTDRQKLADDGVICMALTVSLTERKIVAGPDIQMRGFVLVKDSESLLHDLGDIFVSTVNEQLQSKEINLDVAKQSAHDKAIRLVHRTTGKNPMILPLVVEIAEEDS